MMNITIIGGEGNVGTHAEAILKKQGFDVSIINETTSDEDKEKLLKESKIVMFAVPLKEAVEIIKSYSGIVDNILNSEDNIKNKRFIDLTGLKEGTMEAMEETFGKLGRIVGIHNLYRPVGPDDTSFKNRNYAVIDGKRCANPLITKTIENGEGNVVKMTAEKHDETMAVIQPLTHFINILFIKTINDLGIDISKLNGIFEKLKNPHNFGYIELMLTESKRILAGNPELYFDMAQMNSYFSGENQILDQLGTEFEKDHNIPINIDVISKERQDANVSIKADFIKRREVSMENLKDEEKEIINTLEQTLTLIFKVYAEIIKNSGIDLELVGKLGTPVSNPIFFIGNHFVQQELEDEEDTKKQLLICFKELQNMIELNNRDSFTSAFTEGKKSLVNFKGNDVMLSDLNWDFLKTGMIFTYKRK